MITSTFLNNTMGTVFSSLTGQNQAVTCIYLCNRTNQVVTANVYAVPNGEPVPADCNIYDTIEIQAKDTVILDSEKLILENGDALWADASVPGGVRMTVSSVRI